MSVANTGVPTAASVPITEQHDCPIREVLDRIGDKWSVLVVVLLGTRTHRFNELHRAIEGISQRMLTVTLRGLQRDGLVSRTVHPSVPPKVEYALTELGRTLLGPLSAVADWAIQHRDDIREARARYDTRDEDKS
ncbi:MAG TPA: helix-turn-helix domain-containing protein [Jiangellaceae bacterium]